jgi:hypothetical protein
MTALLFITVFLLIAVASPFFGTDSSDARSEGARPAQGWFPGAVRRQA